MATIEKLLVTLGLEDSNYSVGIGVAIDDTTRFADNAQKNFSSFENIAIGALHRVGEMAIDAGRSIVSNLIDQGKQAIQTAAEYETMESVFRVTSGATGEQMQRMSALALQLGDDITLPGASAKSAAEAMIELNRRGIDVENSFSGARGVLELSAAAGLKVADAATIGANVLDIYGKKGEELGQVNDQLVNTFKSTGVSVEMQASALEKVGPVMQQLHIPLEDTLVMIGELGKKGIEGSEAGTQLRGMFMSLMSPSTQAKEAIANLGLTIYDTTGKMKAPTQLIEDFSKVQVGAQVTMHMTSEELEKIADKADKTRDQLGKLSEKHAELATRMEENTAQLTKATEAYTSKRVQAEQDYHDRLDQLGTQADQKRQDAANALGQKLFEIDAAHHDKLAGLADAAAQKRLDLEAAYGDKLATLATTYQRKVQDLEQSHVQKLVDIADAAAQKRADIEEGYGEKMQDLARSYQRKLDDLADTFAAKRVEAATQYHDTLDKLERDHNERTLDLYRKAQEVDAEYADDRLARARNLADKIAGIERATEYKQQDLTENFQYDQQDQEENHQNKLTDIQTDYQRKMADLQAQLQGNLTDKQREAILQRMADAKTAYDRAVQDEQTRYTRQQEQTQEHYDRQIEQLQQQHDREVAEAQRKAEADQAEADARYQAQQVELQRERDAEAQHYVDLQAQAQTAYNQQLTDLQAQQVAAQSAAQTAYERQIADAQTAYERQVADLQTHLQQQQDTENAAYLQRQSAAQTAYVQQQQDAQANYDQQLVAVQTNLDRQNAAEQANYEKARTQAQANYDQQLTAIQTNLDRQTVEVSAAYEKQEQRARDAFNTSFTELQASVNKRQGELQREMTNNETAINSAQTLLGGYDQTLRTHGEHVETLTQQKIDETKAIIFGRENMAAANIVLGGGIEQYTTLRQKIDETGSAQELAQATTNGLEGAIAGLNNTIETLQLELGKEALPIAAQVIKDITQYISDHKADIKAFVTESVIPLAQKIVEVAEGFTKAGDKTKYLKDMVDQNSGPIVDAIGGIAVKAALKLGELAPGMAVSLLQGLEQGLNKQWGSAGGSGIVQLLTGGLWGLLTAWWGIQSPSTKMAEMGRYIVDGLWSGISGRGIANDIYTWFDQNIVHKMQGLLNTFPDIGKNIVGGLLQGIQNAWSNAGSIWGNFVNSLPQSVRDALGIHSPSRVMMELGGYAAQGLIVGVQRMTSDVADAGGTLGAALSGGVGPLTVSSGVGAAAVGGVSGSATTNRQTDTVEISIPDFNKLAEALRAYYIELKRRQNLGF